MFGYYTNVCVISAIWQQPGLVAGETGLGPQEIHYNRYQSPACNFPGFHYAEQIYTFYISFVIKMCIIHKKYKMTAIKRAWTS